MNGWVGEDGTCTGGLTRMGHEWEGRQGWGMGRRVDEDGV